MEDTALDEKREHHRRMVIEENEGGRDDEKYFIHIKRWQSYMSKKQ